MIAATKPGARAIRLPRWDISRLFGTARRRRQATIDLIHSSPHLLRDIGLAEGHVGIRRP